MSRKMQMYQKSAQSGTKAGQVNVNEFRQLAPMSALKHHQQHPHLQPQHFSGEAPRAWPRNSPSADLWRLTNRVPWLIDDA